MWISTLTEHPESVVKGYTVAKEVFGLKFAKQDDIYALAPWIDSETPPFLTHK